jgi:predicted nucleotide-binding protein
MALNQKLLGKLADTLGVTRSRVYALIQQTAQTNHLPPHVASLKLAADSGVSYGRYASDDDLAALRAISHSSGVTVGPASPSTAKAARANATKVTAPKQTRDNSIFVVHGRDLKLRDDMYAFLRAIGLFPLEWDQAIKKARGGANPIVGDIIHDAMKKVQGVMVLLSPDESAKLKSKFVGTRDKRQRLNVLEGQPRPNVIFEAGLALGAHTQKTILVQVGEIREISDIAGRHMLHLTNDPSRRKALAHRLRDKLHFKVNLDGDTWLEVGNFER